MAYLEEIQISRGFIKEISPYYLCTYLNFYSDSDYPKILHVGISENHIRVSFIKENITPEHFGVLKEGEKRRPMFEIELLDIYEGRAVIDIRCEQFINNDNRPEILEMVEKDLYVRNL